MIANYNDKNSNDKDLKAHQASSNKQELARKTLEDIHFLESRIERIKLLSHPNTRILETYESMLLSRHSVLNWLVKQGAQLDQIKITAHNQEKNS